jgi:hypothetical protein
MSPYLNNPSQVLQPKEMLNSLPQITWHDYIIARYFPLEQKGAVQIHQKRSCTDSCDPYFHSQKYAFLQSKLQKNWNSMHLENNVEECPPHNLSLVMGGTFGTVQSTHYENFFKKNSAPGVRRPQGFLFKKHLQSRG